MHLTSNALGYIVAALCCLLCMAWGEPAEEAPLPPAPTEQSADAPPQDSQDSELSLLQSTVIKVSLLAVVGMVLALIPGTKMNIFENGVDIFFTCVISCAFIGFFLYDDAQHTFPLTHRVAALVILAVLLVPYALVANGGKVWTLLVIVPARLVVSLLLLASGVIFFISSVGMLANRRRQANNVISASFFGLATLGIGKLIQYTTRSYRS